MTCSSLVPLHHEFLKRVCLVLVIALLWTASAGAQARLAEVSGTVTDESGAVLPGVTVTATHLDTGQKRSTITESRGGYVFAALPLGTYEFRADLAGFALVVISGYRIGIGESFVLNIKMKLATVEETVTVQAEAPLVNTTKSSLTGKIDRVQIEELPVIGRNWLVYATLAPGVKSDGKSEGFGPGVSGSAPTAGVGDGRFTKVLLDGAAVQNRSTGAGIDLEVSKEIIGEFEVITNRFDAQMGRAGSAIVNAVTKSGSDTLTGGAFGYFRHDRLNARDFFTGRVEPYQSRQYGGTFGGPLVKGRTHFFVNYERQVEPRTVSANTGIPLLDVPVDGTATRNLGMLRLDHSLTPSHRLSGRFNYFDLKRLNEEVGGPTSTSSGLLRKALIKRYNLGLDSVFAGRWVNQFLFAFLDTDRTPTRMSEGPRYSFPSVTIGGRPGAGHEISFYRYLRNDVSYSFEKAGRHALKFGGEYEHSDVQGVFAANSNGNFFYNQDPPNLATCCPGVDQSKWDIFQFPIPVRYTVALGDFSISAPNDIYSAYLQDDWTLGPHLTLNLGVRYDLEVGSLGHDVTGLTTKPHKNDVDNIQPRFGFAWDLGGNAKTVVRGGGGLYYDQAFLNLLLNHIRSNSGRQVLVTVFNPSNDPNFTRDPLGGRTFEDFRGTGGATNVQRIAEGAEQPYVWTWSIGLARQLTTDLAVSADYVGQRSNSMFRSIDSNLFCCLPDGNALPIVTGVFPELGGRITGAGRPDRRFNVITNYSTDGRSRYHGLQVAMTKRMRQNYQFGLTYLLSRNKDNHNGAFSFPNNMFDVTDEYSDSLQDQRHRFVLNWVAALPYSWTFGGIVFVASGSALPVSTGGVDVNGDGSNMADRPTCGRDPRFNPGCTALGVPAGRRVPRNALRSDTVYRVDLRLSRKFRAARVTVEPMIEVFNVSNRQNGDPLAYNTNLASPRFGFPGRSGDLPYLPRQIQLAARVSF